ncbi:MAG: galactokinase [Chloroflexota bacterium]|nr:galactokinase [Chloroflexota bacterium]
MAKELSFKERFGREPKILVRSPGRVNLIGEHTDYNLGFVLPTAIDRYTKLAAAPRPDNKLVVHSETIGESIEIDLGGHLALVGQSAHWTNYVRGTAWWMREHEYTPVGADVLIWGDLPIGAGLSSSASVLMGLLSALMGVAGWDIPKQEMARATQKIENSFIGVPTGIMDQMAIAVSEARSALLLDCRSMNCTNIPLNLSAAGLSLVVVNSGMTRDLADSAYARRRKECESAVGALKVITYNLEIQSLRDVTPEMLAQYGGKLYPTLFKRAKHVVTENARVLKAVVALSVNDFESMGQLMNQSHESLRNDFEVSNMFMDRLVELAQETKGVLGARLTGAGFGGCTVNLVETSAVRAFDRNVVRRYAEETSLKAETYVVRPLGGIEQEILS